LRLAGLAARITGYKGSLSFDGPAAASRTLVPSRHASRWLFRDLDLGLKSTVATLRAQDKS
jgi:hypothetical protein